MFASEPIRLSREGSCPVLKISPLWCCGGGRAATDAVDEVGMWRFSIIFSALVYHLSLRIGLLSLKRWSSYPQQMVFLPSRESRCTRFWSQTVWFSELFFFRSAMGQNSSSKVRIVARCAKTNWCVHVRDDLHSCQESIGFAHRYVLPSPLMASMLECLQACIFVSIVLHKVAWWYPWSSRYFVIGPAAGLPKHGLRCAFQLTTKSHLRKPVCSQK